MNKNNKLIFLIISMLFLLAIFCIHYDEGHHTKQGPLESSGRIYIKKEPAEKPYTEEDLYLLSHIMNGEAGCSWFSDQRQQLVGLVVLNRVRSEKFPNSIREVIFAEGQYSSTWDGNFEKEPSERIIENARKVLAGEADIQCPENVVYQAEFSQGSGIYMKIYDEILDTTTYFCYL